MAILQDFTKFFRSDPTLFDDIHFQSQIACKDSIYAISFKLHYAKRKCYYITQTNINELNDISNYDKRKILLYIIK